MRSAGREGNWEAGSRVASEHRLPGAGERLQERGQAEQGVIERRLGDRCGAARDDEAWRDWGGVGVGVGAGTATKWWWEGQGQEALRSEAPTPGSLLTRWEVREPPNFLLFNEPRRRGCPEGVCSLKM